MMSGYPSFRINISQLCCQLMPVAHSHVEAASDVHTASFGRRTANWCWFPVALQLFSSMRGAENLGSKRSEVPKVSAAFRRSMSIFFFGNSAVFGCSRRFSFAKLFRGKAWEHNCCWTGVSSGSSTIPTNFFLIFLIACWQ